MHLQVNPPLQPPFNLGTSAEEKGKPHHGSPNMSGVFLRHEAVVSEYCENMPDGGNPLAVDVNAQYACLEFHYVYQILMAFFVFLIVPGLGLLYGGTSQRSQHWP